MRSKFPVAVHMLFFRDQEVLLLRRYNTGYEDGNYSLVAGHLDAGETVTQAAIREAGEEVGVTLGPDDLRVAHVMSRKSNDERIDFFIEVRHWEGEITNREPEKCDQLAWFALTALPDNMIPYVRAALERCRQGLYYSEFGW